MMTNQHMHCIINAAQKPLFKEFECIQQYLHEQTNHGKGASKIHNQDVDQMSTNGNNGSKMQIPQDGIYKEP